MMHPGPWLQVEISASCQAGCVDCARWVPQGGWHHWEPGAHTQFALNGNCNYINTVYDIHAWQQHIQQFNNLKHINLCGNMGDPMAHPKIVEVCRLIQQYHTQCEISISTNGGIGSVANYRQLADLGVTVTFAIDGLQDTNHIYRRGVDWHRLEQRFSAFIESHGSAVWAWVDFPHTRHQIHTAKKLSQDWGFRSFVIQQRWSQEPEIDQLIVDSQHQPVDLKTIHSESQQDSNTLIGQHRDYVQHMIGQGRWIDAQCANTPKHLDHYHPEPNLTADGRLWPCCFLSDIRSHKMAHIRHWWNKHTKNMPKDWNSLFHHSVDEIVKSEWWNITLPNSWKTENIDQVNPVCLAICGKCNHDENFNRR